MGVPGGEKREKGTEGLFKETVARNVPNLERSMNSRYMKLIGPQTDSKRFSPEHIIIKLKNQRQRENSETKSKETYPVQWNTPVPEEGYQISQHNPGRPGSSGMTYLKGLKKKNLPIIRLVSQEMLEGIIIIILKNVPCP